MTQTYYELRDADGGAWSAIRIPSPLLWWLGANRAWAVVDVAIARARTRAEPAY
jgi:hypothetical protein